MRALTDVSFDRVGVGESILMKAIAGVVQPTSGRILMDGREIGRYVHAVGGGERAAGLSGIRVNRVKVIVYVSSGFCAALFGLVILSQRVAIAVVLLGGTSMSGSLGTIGGTIIGALVIGILSGGLVIILAIVDQAQRRLRQRVMLRQVAKGA